jgi:tRNA dimethylallyltransferase
MSPTLVAIIGPTAVGKTEIGVQLAEHFSSEIISADSRQMYRELKVGTALPSSEQLSRAKHHLIGNLSIHDY